MRLRQFYVSWIVRTCTAVAGPFRLLCLASLLAVCAGFGTAQAQTGQAQTGQTQYTIGPGDVLELRIIGETDEPWRVRVDELGQILAPLIGQINLQGRTFQQAVALLRAQYVSSQFLSDPQISITLSQGRPFIISGDVKNPGAYPSRPNMTAEEAIALAGGHRVGGVFNPLDYSEERLEARLTASWTDLFEAELGIARRRAEIAFSDEIDVPFYEGSPLSEAYIAARVADETSILLGSNLVYRREISDLLEMQGIAEEEVAVVAALRVQIDESVQQLREVLAEEKDLLDRGLQTRNNFLTAQQRLENAISGFSSQSLTAGQAQRRLVEIKSRLDNLEVDRSGILTAEIATLSAKLPVARAALASIQADRLLVSSFSNYASTDFIRVGLQVRRGPPGAKETLPATPDMQILPGDVLAVAVEFSFDAQ